MEGNIKKSQIRTMAKDLEQFRSARLTETSRSRAEQAGQGRPATTRRDKDENILLTPALPTKDGQETKPSTAQKSAEPSKPARQDLPATTSGMSQVSEPSDTSKPKEERKLSEILAEARKRVSQAEPSSPQPTPPTQTVGGLSRKTEPSTQKITKTTIGETKEPARDAPLTVAGKPTKTSVPPKTIDDLLPIEPFNSTQSKPSPNQTKPFDSAQDKPIGVGIPSNLPIGEPLLTVLPEERPANQDKPGIADEPDPQSALRRPDLSIKEKDKTPMDVPLRTITPPQKPEPSSTRPESLDRQARKTPEEILGLPARDAPLAVADGPMKQIPTPLTTESAKSLDSAQSRPTPIDQEGPVSKKEISASSLEKIVRAPERSSIKPARKKLKLRAMPIPKFVIISTILGVILISASYGIYWKLFLQSESSVPPTPTPEISEPLIPQPLVNFEERRILEITSLQYDTLKPKLDTLASDEFLPQSLVYVPIKHISDTEKRFISLSEILQILQIDAPPAILDPKSFTLYAYSPSNEELELCFEAGITDKSCYGPRLGIVMELWDEGEGILTQDTAVSVMAQWEKTIINDLRPLILANPKIPEDYILGEKFGVGKYKNFETHYKNFPISTISIDWLISDKYLIIATSKNAARAAVDNLK